MDPITAYPLSWPMGQPRTPDHRRDRNWHFSKSRTLAVARDELLAELARLGATSVVLSTNLRLRQDGLPAANQARPSDPGVAVYFLLGGLLNSQPVVLACDKWELVEQNMWAIRLHIEALRGTKRWGVGRANQAFAGYKALPDSRTNLSMTVAQAAGLIGDLAIVPAGAILSDQVTFLKAYRDAAASTHPDRGGSHEDFVRLQEAKRVLEEHHQNQKEGKS